MKKTILISSLIIIGVLMAEAYRENLNMDWQHYQRLYKGHLKLKAETLQEKQVAQDYKIKMRQIVLPELNRVDRCVICHVGLEDARMKDMPNPLKTHPGDYLQAHEIEKVGCTMCHDGQGLAITFEDALAHGHDQYWEKPALLKPYLEANCYRCHDGTLAQTPVYNAGKELFESRGCLGCHQINGKGGIKGPDISNLGNASVHVKAPVTANREHLLSKFHDNINLAYLYESVFDPHAQPANSAMVDYQFTEEEALRLTVFLKSLTTENVPGDLVANSRKEILPSGVENGARMYGMYCSACHGPKGEGTHLKELDKIGPAIGNSEFLSIADDKLLSHVIRYSRGGEMPPFKTVGGLSEGDIGDIVTYIRSLIKEPPTLQAVNEVNGNAKFGEVLFSRNCASCHGAGGKFEQDLIGPTLNNPTLLGLASREFWYNTIVGGRPGTAMPAWHFLKAEQLSDLMAYLESLKPETLDKDIVMGLVRGVATVENGQKLYQGYCASCHGASGQGGLAPSLNNQEFQSISDAGFIFNVISKGRRDTAMPSWNHLTPEAVADIIAFIKSWQTGESIPLPEEPIIGSEREGKIVFESSCQKCHQAGRGSVVAPAILSEGFLSQANDHYIKYTLMYGRGHTQMPPALLGQAGVVELTDQEINSLVAYIRSFEDNPVDLKGTSTFYGDRTNGQELFARNCAQCHGDFGEGGIGPAIGKRGFLNTVSDGFIYAMMRVGRPGSEMKAFPRHGDGFSHLDDKEAADIISFLRSNIADAELYNKKVRGHATRGEELFARACAQCHGPQGDGGIAPSLNSENFLNSVSDSYLQATMSLGRHGTQMRPMMKGGGGVVELSSQDVNDIIVFLRSLIQK